MNKLALLLVLSAGCIFAQSVSPTRTVDADPSGACVAKIENQFNERNGKYWGCVDSTGIGYGTWTQISGSGGIADPGSNGPIKRTALNVTAPVVASDIVGLFSTCSGTQYLGADGACHAGSGAGITRTVVSFSATPLFARSSQIQIWEITLTGNVTGPTTSGLTGGDILIFKVCQDGTGSRLFAWPTGFSSAATISATLSTCTDQTFYWDGSAAVNITGGVSTDPLDANPPSATVLGTDSLGRPVARTLKLSCDIPIGNTNGSAIANGDIGPQIDTCFMPMAATVLEVDVRADAGTPNVIVGVRHSGSVSNLTSSALATAAAGARACSKLTAVACIDGTTASATLQNTNVVAGDSLELVSGTAGGTAKWMAVHIVYSLN